MFKNVLVGIGPRTGAEDALALALKLRGTEGELTVAHVYDGLLHASLDDYVAAARERAWSLLEEVSQAAGVDAAMRWRESPSVGRGLHELCEVTGADLLVVGSSRRGLLGRVLLGDDTHAALNGAPCAIAVAPAGYAARPNGIRRIGVGYDGSPESEEALAAARTLADEHSAALAAMDAVSVPTRAVLGGATALAGVIEDIVSAARERLARLDGVEPFAVYGSAAEELAAFSATVDLLVVGSRGYGPLGRLMHGSTSQQLTRLVRSPLLVLPRPAAASIEAATARETVAVAQGGADLSTEWEQAVPPMDS